MCFIHLNAKSRSVLYIHRDFPDSS
uniref:Uncharacterized protein n=1 Tax=Arundo donax TaxID=35708 RepID=A0A0A9BBT2_ARUDO